MEIIGLRYTVLISPRSLRLILAPRLFARLAQRDRV